MWVSWLKESSMFRLSSFFTVRDRFKVCIAADTAPIHLTISWSILLSLVNKTPGELLQLTQDSSFYLKRCTWIVRLVFMNGVFQSELRIYDPHERSKNTRSSRVGVPDFRFDVFPVFFFVVLELSIKYLKRQLKYDSPHTLPSSDRSLPTGSRLYFWHFCHLW